MRYLFLTTVLLLMAGCSQQKKAPLLPNILFIAVDDLRPELGCYGVERIHSPNIDRLAQQGTRFDRSYCNIPVCGASRASLMTGLRPARNRFLYYDTRADEDAPGITTLPQLFRENGYHTISNGKVFHHGDDAAHSWDEIWHPPSSSRSWRDYAMPGNILQDTAPSFRGPPFERAVLHDTIYKDGKTAEKVISDLRRLKEMDKPFFLAAGFLKPHLPFNAPEKYWKLYDGTVRLPYNNYPPDNAPPESLHNWGELRNYAQIPEKGPVSDEMARELIHGYDACVSYTDAQIGKVLDELRRLGLENSTIVILWGDHGWNLREHGLWCKHCNYETSLHTPLILKVPDTEQVPVTDEIVEYVDIYPTLCELAGLDQPEHLQGSSFMELLFDPAATSDGVAVCQWFDGITTIREHYFYTEWVDDSDVAYTRMLYDHLADPDENVNISEVPGNAGIVEGLSTQMRRSRADNYFRE
jgi:iduronate 2-sulfatase